MALGNALKFVKQACYDRALRAQCNQYPSKFELLTALDFDEIEFDDAVNMQLVKCQDYEEAEQIQQIRLWFSMLIL